MNRSSNTRPSYPRDLAARALTRVHSDCEPLDTVLETLAGGRTHSESRAWLQDVTAGALRWKGRLDLAIDAIALKKKPTGWLRRMLEIACFQIIAQDRVVAAKVVSETVDAIREKEGEPPSKFANALLRKVAVQGKQWKELPFPGGSEAENARWASLPPWLWKKIASERGEAWARAFALSGLERPVIWLRSKDATPAGWPEGALQAGPVVGSFAVRKTPGGPVTSWPGFAAGKWIVQDVSSQKLVTEMHAAVRDSVVASPTALDLCAAPGGKAVAMAWLGARVTATDKDERRLALLRSTEARTKAGVEIVTRATLAERADAAFDWVWVDAPCTGTGITGRHPDVKWIRREAELKGILATQRKLVEEGWRRVRPGGFLSYSVCSVLREEGAELLRAAIPGARPEHEWRLDPQDAPHGDGFWAALLRRPA